MARDRLFEDFLRPRGSKAGRGEATYPEWPRDREGGGGGTVSMGSGAQAPAWQAPAWDVGSGFYAQMPSGGYGGTWPQAPTSWEDWLKKMFGGGYLGR